MTRRTAITVEGDGVSDDRDVARWSHAAFSKGDNALAGMDFQGRFVKVNHAFERVTGLAAKDVCGRPFTDFWAVDLLGPDVRLLERLRSDGAVTVDAEPVAGEDAPPKIAIRFVLTSDAMNAQSPIGIQLVSADAVAETRQISNDSRGFQLSFDQIAVGMMITGMDGNVVRVNDAFCTLMGRSRDEIAAIDIVAMVHPDDRLADIEQGLRAYAGEIDGWTREKRMFRGDGTMFWVLETATLVRDELNAPLHFLSQFLDIDDRKQAEHERNAALDALRLSESQVKFLADGIPVALAEIANDGRIRSGNAVLGQLLARDPIGRSMVELIHPDDLELVTHAFYESVGGADEWLVEFRVVRPDGSIRWVRSHSRTHVDAGGNFMAATSTWTDITDEMGVRRDLEAAEAQLLLQATTDSLTGLSNRVILYDRLGNALARTTRHTHHVAVLFVDLDHFKPVNDQWGHEAGDDLLVQVAERLVEAVRDGDTVSRIGGDEFVILAEPIARIEDAVVIADRIVDSVALPFVLGSEKVRISASVGVAMCNQFMNAPDAVRLADQAMYRAKAEGRSRVVVAGDRPACN